MKIKNILFVLSMLVLNLCLIIENLHSQAGKLQEGRLKRTIPEGTKIYNPEKDGFIWEYMTVKNIVDYLKNKQTAVLPVGCVEQHGYHLPTCMDYIQAYEVSKKAGKKSGSIVLPPVMYGYSGGTLPGTINVDPYVVSLCVSEICKSLYSQGFRIIIIVGGHGGTEHVAAIKNGTTMFLRNNPQIKDLAISYVGVYQFVPREYIRKDDKPDYHAAHFETSAMMYLRPGLVREKYYLDPPEVLNNLLEDPDNYQKIDKSVDDENVFPQISQRPDMLVGVMGDPSEATYEWGKRLIESAADGLAEYIKKIESLK